MCCQGFLSKCIKLSSTRIAFDGRVEAISVERVKPGAKSRQFSGRQLLHGFFNVFGVCHGTNITPETDIEKTVREARFA
jgi:hypothetical protein